MTREYSKAFLDENREFNVHHDWWDAVYYDFSEICDILGIELDDREPSFSGFWSQGSGASWTGRYRAQGLGPKYTVKHTAEIAPAKIRERAPKDVRLHRIADELCFLSQLYGATYVKVGRSNSCYVHSSTMQIDEWEFYEDEKNDDVPLDIVEHVSNTLLEMFTDLADWLYEALQSEYEHLTSDEAVAEALEANEIYEEDEECLD